MKMFRGQLVTVDHGVEIQPPCLESIYPRMSKQRMRRYQESTSRPLSTRRFSALRFRADARVHVIHVCVWVCSLLLLGLLK